MFFLSFVVSATRNKNDTNSSFFAYTSLTKSTDPVTSTIDISAINEPVYFAAMEYMGTLVLREIKLEA